MAIRWRCARCPDVDRNATKYSWTCERERWRKVSNIPQRLTHLSPLFEQNLTLYSARQLGSTAHNCSNKCISPLNVNDCYRSPLVMQMRASMHVGEDEQHLKTKCRVGVNVCHIWISSRLGLLRDKRTHTHWYCRHLATFVHVICTCTTSIKHTIYHISDAYIRFWLSHKSHYSAARNIRWRDANLWLYAPVTYRDIVCFITMSVQIYIIGYSYLYVHNPIPIVVRGFVCEVFARATNELGNFSPQRPTPVNPVLWKSDRIIIDRIYDWIYICSTNISLSAIQWMRVCQSFVPNQHIITNNTSFGRQMAIAYRVAVCCALADTPQKKTKTIAIVTVRIIWAERLVVICHLPPPTQTTRANQIDCKSARVPFGGAMVW